MANRPLTAGMAATLFAVCTVLIVASMTWQRIDAPPRRGTAANAADVPRQPESPIHALKTRTEPSAAPAPTPPPKPSAQVQDPPVEASAEPAPDKKIDRIPSAATGAPTASSTSQKTKRPSMISKSLPWAYDTKSKKKKKKKKKKKWTTKKKTERGLYSRD
jgi:hypothetical protein